VILRQPFAIWLCLALGLCLYGLSLFHHQAQQTGRAVFFTGGLPPSAQQVLAGPFAGVAADLNLLDVFSIYNVIRHRAVAGRQTSASKHQTAPDKLMADNSGLWEKLKQRLFAAQALDPWFWDVYRLTVGLMAFHKQDAPAAVNLLSKGAAARSWDWEMPFMAGYLAYDFLHDDKRAYTLMAEALKRPNAPSLAVGLAAQFLKGSKGSAASIRFLRYLKYTMPASYRGVIDARIKRLQQPMKQIKKQP